MEHLSRNTSNEKLIYTINLIKNEGKDLAEREIEKLVDKIVNISTGILSSVFSACVISLIKKDTEISLNIICTLLIFLTIFLAAWYVATRWLIPFFYKQLVKEKPIKLKKESVKEAVKRFNSIIIPKVAEINESTHVAINTLDFECKLLNLVLSVYRFQEIVNFLYDKFYIDKMEIRKKTADNDSDLLRYSFNNYTISSILMIISKVEERIQILLNDDGIKNLIGYDLLLKDCQDIFKKVRKVKDEILRP